MFYVILAATATATATATARAGRAWLTFLLAGMARAHDLRGFHYTPCHARKTRMAICINWCCLALRKATKCFLYGQPEIGAGLSNGGPSLVLVAEAGDELAKILGTPIEPMGHVPTDDEWVWSSTASSLVRLFDQSRCERGGTASEWRRNGVRLKLVQAKGRFGDLTA